MAAVKDQGASADLATHLKDSGPTNPRGIPQAPFVNSVADYVSSRAEVESTLRSFQEMISKYQFMEVNTQRRAEGLRDKLPEMKGTLDVVNFLRLQKSGSEDDGAGDEEASDEVEATFSLNDTLYAKAKVNPQELDEVYLWLGANVMVAYPMDEAQTMLKGKLESATKKLQECEEDLEFLREQVTTLEVATARVYNWDVMQKRLEKAQGKGGNEEEGDSNQAS
ncbi:MAG: hypothetical protein Q9160_000290 [Pyrenula sp. 1 TL-2023]